MKKIKIASLWNATVKLKTSLIVNLIKVISNKDIEFTEVKNCDLLIFGPYEQQSVISIAKRRLINKVLKNKKLRNNYPNLDIYLLKRNYNPIKIFLSFENYKLPEVKYDFAITSCMGIVDEKHLRLPLWKELIDWSNYGVERELSDSAKRFGKYYNLEELIKPNKISFMNKKKEMCMITSHLNEPRNSIFKKFSKKFKVDGYGSYFNNRIKDHNSDPIKKIDILKNYAFNLCPENSLYPGYYTEKIPEAFLGGCLPISWVDQNVKYDFNENSFINLLDYTNNNYVEIIEQLNDNFFLKKFTNQPLLLKKPNLDYEINFVKKIINSL
jgi:hypothetical protein